MNLPTRQPLSPASLSTRSLTTRARSTRILQRLLRENHVYHLRGWRPDQTETVRLPYDLTKKGSTSSASTTRRVRHLLCGRRADKDLERRPAHELQISDGQLPGSPPGSTTVSPARPGSLLVARSSTRSNRNR